MPAHTVLESPVHRLERVSRHPLPTALRKVFASNLSEKHQAALLEWVEGVIRAAHEDGEHNGRHPTYDPDPFND